jgi:hypothetical protein
MVALDAFLAFLVILFFTPFGWIGFLIVIVVPFVLYSEHKQTMRAIEHRPENYTDIQLLFQADPDLRKQIQNSLSKED